LLNYTTLIDPGLYFKREYLLTSPPLSPSPFKERGRNKKEGGFAPFLKLLPPSPLGEGGQGDRVISNLFKLGFRDERY
jgi:hypothetical protein